MIAFGLTSRYGSHIFRKASVSGMSRHSAVLHELTPS